MTPTPTEHRADSRAAPPFTHAGDADASSREAHPPTPAHPEKQRVIAFLNTQYPSLSHTFIEREIRQLRRLGVLIEPFSIRPPGPLGTLGGHHAAAAGETTVLFESRIGLLSAAAVGLLSCPLSTARALWHSQRLSPGGLRQRLLHAVYAIEAVRLLRCLRLRDIRHVHVHMANNGAAVALLAARCDPSLTYSLSIHGSAEFFQVDSLILRAKVDSALFTRCISNFCRAQIMTFCSEERWNDLHVVHCGIDLAEFTPQSHPSPAPQAHTTAPGPLRLVTVGRLHSIKAYPLLVRACKALGDSGIEWTLDMIGEGSQRGAIEQAARSCGVQDRVRLLGPVAPDDLRARLGEYDALVVSSFMEGVPVVLMEAMASGLPVLATGVGGIPELVTHAVSGIIVPPGSAEALAEGLKQLAARRADFHAMGKAGRAAIAEHFSIEQTAQGMKALFDHALESRPGTKP